MPPTKPSLELLRSLSEEHVVGTLMTHRRATRAEIATWTGLSKPTISETVRRLTAAGVLTDTGERTSGRGRVGTYYALTANAGCALAVSISPEGIVVEAIDVYGDVVARREAEVARPTKPGQVARALKRTVSRVVDECDGPIRLAVISAAEPVDRETGRLVALPDAPFLLGNLDPRAALAGLVDAPMIVDNDVNWAARAEIAASMQSDTDDLAYLYLGEGIGCALVSDGEVRRGHTGVAGEIAHLLTEGPDGRAMRLIDVFGVLGVRQPGSTAIEVPALLESVRGTDAHSSRLRGAVTTAVTGALAAVVALADPTVIRLGGPWGVEPVVLASIQDAIARTPRPVRVEAATVQAEAPLVGVRAAALEELRNTLVAHLPRAPAPTGERGIGSDTRVRLP